MLLLAATTDKLQLTTDSAATVDVVASWMDYNGTTVTPGATPTAISSATTTDIVAAPAASTTRNVKTLHIRNKHATLAVMVTLVFDRSATDYELHKVGLNAGDALEYVEGIGFFTLAAAAKLDAKLVVSADVINSTTSFADITGLTAPVKSGKTYNFLAHLFHISNATTTGAQFGINGPTMGGMRISEIDVILGSATAATMGANVGDVISLDTAAIVETTGAATVVMAGLSGWFNPTANGTFAVRLKSEVAVASGLTVKAGSWCRVWEADN